MTVALDLEHILFSRGHGPGRDLFRRPGLEYARYRSSFQGEANFVAGLQLRKRLPVVPILRFNRYPDRTQERENEKGTRHHKKGWAPRRAPSPNRFFLLGT